MDQSSPRVICTPPTSALITLYSSAMMVARSVTSTTPTIARMVTTDSTVDRLNTLESAGSHDLDALCNAFGALLGEVFACRDDIWAPALRGMGNGLGAFIYLMDAYDDLEKDSRRGQFNALQQLADELPPAAYEQRCHELLTQQMGRCAQQFEMLPILKDTPEGKLLYNTIYSGVWSKYALVRKHREAKRHD